MAQHMSYEEYREQQDTLRLSCDCGWEGTAKEAYGELLDFNCPECDKMLLIVNL